MAFRKARENIAKDASSRKKYCDRNVRCHALEPGDIVLVHRNLFDSNYKIADKWEEEPYMVESQMGDSPIYSIVQMTPGSTSRILHRNMLHPARSIESTQEPQEASMVDNMWETGTSRDNVIPLQALAKANALIDAYFND